MSFLPTGLFFTSITSIVLGCFVVMRKRGMAVSWAWLLMSACVSCWSLFFGFSLIEVHHDRALLFSRICNTAALFIPLFYLIFVTRLIGNAKQYARLLKVAAVSTLSITPFAGTKLFVIDVLPKVGFSFYAHPGKVYPFFTGVFFAIFSAALLLQLRSLANLSPALRIQAKYVLWAGVFGFITGGTTFLPVYGIPFYPWPGGWLWIYCVVITYAILRHQLMDISFVFRKGLVYSLLVSVMTIFYFLAVFVFERVFQGFIGYRSLGAAVVTFVCVAAIFQPLKNRVQFFMDRYFFKGNQEYLAQQLELAQQELKKGEQLKAVALLASGMAHEIKNPLTSLKTFAEYLPERYDQPKFRHQFSRIVSQEVDRITAIVQQVLDFARPKAPVLQEIDLHKLLDDSLCFLTSEFLRRSITVQKDYAPAPIRMLADSAQMRQVILNLILNALDAMENSPQKVLTIKTDMGAQCLSLIVEDTGVGIAEGDVAHVFDPFFTTKEKGTGLGLCVVDAIVKEHGGTIGVRSKKGEGSSLTLSFARKGRS